MSDNRNNGCIMCGGLGKRGIGTRYERPCAHCGPVRRRDENAIDDIDADIPLTAGQMRALCRRADNGSMPQNRGKAMRKRARAYLDGVE
jgi:hypothetical protein